MAALGPYYGFNLPIYPGSGDTACLGNCKCTLVREDGVPSFAPVPLIAGPADEPFPGLLVPT
jgi:hypothetical protein